MVDLAEHHALNVVKLLLLGDSGSGKTGALASLADAGYNLRIIDLDNGIDVLKNMLLDPKTPYKKDAHKRVKVKTLTEAVTSLSATPGVPKQATVWNKLINTLNHWKDGVEDLGPVETWTSKDILVIDSLTFAGYAAMNFSAVMNSGNRNQDGRMVYFHAQNYIEHLIQKLYGDDINCHVIITGHIQFMGDDMTIMHGYPATVGRALSPKIGRYFNSILMVKSDGQSRKIYTTPISRVELKNSAPLSVKPSYDIKFGLAEFFSDVLTETKPTPAVKVA